MRAQQGGLAGFDWARDQRETRSRGRNPASGAGNGADAAGPSENDWRRKTMHLRNGLPNGLSAEPAKGFGEGPINASPRKAEEQPARRGGGGGGGGAQPQMVGAKSIGGKYPPGMFFGGGGKKENQDDFFHHVAENGDFVAGALDGHGLNGKTVSNYCKRELSKRLAPCVGINGRATEARDVEQRLTEAVLGTSNDLQATSIGAHNRLQATSFAGLRFHTPMALCCRRPRLRHHLRHGGTRAPFCRGVFQDDTVLTSVGCGGRSSGATSSGWPTSATRAA